MSSRVPIPTPTTTVLPPRLLATKLTPPTARARWVARPRLFAVLEAGLKGKLTVIAAPAGFGKTTLLGAWRATAAGGVCRFAWVSLDAGDNDPPLFWSYVLTALDSRRAGRWRTRAGRAPIAAAAADRRLLTQRAECLGSAAGR